MSEERTSEHSPIWRFVEKDVGSTKTIEVYIYSDDARLPQDFEFVGAVSQRHMEGLGVVTLFVRRGLAKDLKKVVRLRFSQVGEVHRLGSPFSQLVEKVGDW